MQKRSYRRLRAEDRQIIYRMSKLEKTQEEISLALGVSQSAVSKELTRNRGVLRHFQWNGFSGKFSFPATKYKRAIKLSVFLKPLAFLFTAEKTLLRPSMNALVTLSLK